MPVTNRPFGVWKVLQWTDTNLSTDLNQKRFIVENATVATQQDIKTERFLQGTALPVILNVGGATATMKVVAPLLVGPNMRVEGTSDTIHDGYTLWQYICNPSIAAGMFSSLYELETGMIIEELNFSIDATKGARYTFSLKGDSNYLGEELVSPNLPLPSTTLGLTLIDGADVWTSGDKPFIAGTPLRVASFYDVTATIGSMAGWLENFQITYKFTTSGFNYVGQSTQRQILGISGAEVTFQGTMISSTGAGLRSPRGYEFPWQGMNEQNDITAGTVAKTPSGYEGAGGIVHYNPNMTLAIRLRNGINQSGNNTIDILPHVTVGKNLIQQSSVQYSGDLIRTSFNGMAWITDPASIFTP